METPQMWGNMKMKSIEFEFSVDGLRIQVFNGCLLRTEITEWNVVINIAW